MTFAVEAEIYDRFVGRYGDSLASALVDLAGVSPGMRALDVGAGTGKLTGVLAEILGEENVAAVDPSEPFVTALETHFPDADVRIATAEELPFADSSFDATFAQLVFNFLTDPKRGLAEMLRVTRDGGVVAAAVWDYGQRMVLLTTFWEAAAALDRRGVEALDERTRMRFGKEGGLAELWLQAGLHDSRSGEIVVFASYESFDDLWEPFTRGVGPAGAYAASLDHEKQGALRDDYRRRLGSPQGPFELEARAWYAVGTR